MVTSNKLPDKKVVKMSEQCNSDVVPQRTLLGEVNEHITCPLCRGYYIDATTIVECLHSFCRSCIIKHLQVKSYCPVCEMMINSAKPNIKPDKALQDIVYKLVPGLFQKEMERRQQFYSSRPGPAASATPEQRGEDTERIIFSPEDVISFSLEYADGTDADSISSKSSDSNEPQQTIGTTRRFLQCPAVVNISHLKKFISMKFDIDSTQFAIDILYKRVALSDYYTLMDIAYIYNWKRNEPMRFFYQITDFIALRTRYCLFDINRKGSHFRDAKASPTPTDDTSASSPAPNLNEQGSEASSGTDSPMLEENCLKKTNDAIKKDEKTNERSKLAVVEDKKVGHKGSASSSKKSDDEVEKSQFLNSFELTAKSSSLKPVTIKLNRDSVNIPSDVTRDGENEAKIQVGPTNAEDNSLKRKQQTSDSPSEEKKMKIEQNKIKIASVNSPNSNTQQPCKSEITGKLKDIVPKVQQSPPVNSPTPPTILSPKPHIKMSLHVPESTSLKRQLPSPQKVPAPKQKPNETQMQLQLAPPKSVSPLKLKLSKPDVATVSKIIDTPKPSVKKIPDLKPSIPPPTASSSNNKGHSSMIGKVRMDLLANNSDPTIDRSKILSQVKTSMGNPNAGGGQMSGDPLKSLFDSCRINIPSSLSITLTDQKLDQRNTNDVTPTENKKGIVNKKLSLGVGSGSVSHIVPSPPVHNYIEILKLPDVEPKPQSKPEPNSQPKSGNSSKSESVASQTKPLIKSIDSSAKGPIPSLKPIADTKLGKATGNHPGPLSFQQTFEKQLQAITTDKSKLPKNKLQVPKLMLATPKVLNAVNKLHSLNRPTPNTNSTEAKVSTKSDNALDLSTPHNFHSQLGTQHNKTLETMQSIANLAKKQNLGTKPMMPSVPQTSAFTSRQLPAAAPLRLPSASSSQQKSDKSNTISTQSTSSKQDMPILINSNKLPSNTTLLSSNNQQSPQVSHNTPSQPSPSPRSQTRSPSSSPKLVIAEEKQSSTSSEQTSNQSSLITSTQLSNINATKGEPLKPSPGPSKQIMKPLKPMPCVTGKLPSMRQPVPTNVKPTMNVNMNHPNDYLAQPHFQQAMYRHQLEIQSAWFKAQKQYDNMFKSMTNMSRQPQNDFKDSNK